MCGMYEAVIQIRLDEILKSRGKSLYWLQQQSGVPYPTLLRWRDNKGDSMDKDVLEKICKALGCEVGELVAITD